MIELAGSDIGRWIAGYLWVLFRIGAVLMTMPVIGTQLLPMRIRLYLALALTALVAPQIAEVPQLEPLALSTWVVIAEQILIGASLGIRTSCVMVSATNCKEYSGQGETQPLKNLEDRAIQVAIEAMRKIIRQDQEKGI